MLHKQAKVFILNNIINPDATNVFYWLANNNYFTDGQLLCFAITSSVKVINIMEHQVYE